MRANERGIARRKIEGWQGRDAYFTCIYIALLHIHAHETRDAAILHSAHILTIGGRKLAEGNAYGLQFSAAIEFLDADSEGGKRINEEQRYECDAFHLRRTKLGFNSWEGYDFGQV